MIGQVLGRYRLLEEVGAGGMGVVYLARDERLEREVALKVIAHDRLGDDTARKRFTKEAQALSRLNHPNIATVHDFGTDQGRDFLVMEHVAGESLKETLAAGPLAETEVVRLGIQIVEGMAAAHAHGVIHRDIKPGNLRVTPEGRLKILDFGLALLSRPASDVAATETLLTEAHGAVGTLPYMSPEQLRGETLDARADLYSTGAVLYELATGRRPFPDTSGAQLIANILDHAPDPPGLGSGAVSADLERIILQLLEKDRRRRHTTATELLEDLERLSGPAPAPTAAVPSAPLFLKEETESAGSEPVLFVAREHELATLGEWLDAALAGRGRVGFVTGEAGRGKTALVAEFMRQAQSRHPDLVITSGNCRAFTGMGDPYLPFREALSQLTGDVEARWAAREITTERAVQLWQTLPVSVQALVESGPDLIDVFVSGRAVMDHVRAAAPMGTTWVAELQALVARKAAQPGASRPAQHLLFEQYSRLLLAVAARHPMLLVLDDLQWADAGSLDLLQDLLPRLDTARLLVVGTYRPDEVALGRENERHPLTRVTNACQARFGDTEVAVGQTGGRAFVDAYLDAEPNRFSQAFRDDFYRHTEGHSLYTVEVWRGLIAQGAVVRDDDGTWRDEVVGWDHLPARVEAQVGERIERLPASLREVLVTASIEGELFAAEVLARVRQVDTREMVRLLSGDLDKRHHLVTAHGIRREGSRRLSQYRFRHILFQTYVYNALDEVERAHLHEDVGRALESLYGDQTAAVAVQLARHFEEAGITDKAIEYLRQAGTEAARKSAPGEAVAHFGKALDLLETLPRIPDGARRELELQAPLAVALINLRGYSHPTVGEAFRRAHELCRQVGETPRLAPVLHGLSAFYVTNAEYGPGLELAEEMLRNVPTAEDPGTMLAAGHNAFAMIMFLRGELETSSRRSEALIASYTSSKHGGEPRDVGTDLTVADQQAMHRSLGSGRLASTLHLASQALWFRGYPDQSREKTRQSLSFVRELGHPPTSCYCLFFAAMSYHFYREMRTVQELTEELRTLAEKYGFLSWCRLARLYDGQTRVDQGLVEEGIAQIREGLDHEASDSFGDAWRTYFNTILVDALTQAGRLEEGLVVLDQSMAQVERTGGRFYEAELNRIKGELLQLQGVDAGEIERHFRQAIDVARGQGARSLELRATVSLCRLWHPRGPDAKCREARQMLEAVYGWFTEGFDTVDLREARALLDH